MRREQPLPAVFASLTGKVQDVHQVSSVEWHSSCPKCGTSGHKGPEPCDRLMLRTDPNPRVQCRKCGYFAFADELDGKQLDPTERRLRMVEQEQRRQAAEIERLAKWQANHEKYCHDRTWELYHDQRGEMGSAYWKGRGLNDSWQGYYQLGFWPNSVWGVPTATIPIFGMNWEPVNMKHRLIGYDKGKYRYEVKGAEAPPLFLCNPELDVAGHVYAIEGEIKAAVTYSRLEDTKAVMVGLPGIEANATTIAPLMNADRVTLVVDPGAKQQGIELARKIGIEKCWLLEPPFKVDDGLLEANYNSAEVRRLLRSAVRLSVFVTGR